jgi:hypothetical protein
MSIEMIQAAAMEPPTASQERLAKPHQLVLLHNTSEVQTHIMRDRFLQSQSILPGAKVEVDMPVDEIETLHDLSRTDRGYYAYGPRKGQPFPPHPVRICGIPPVPSRPIDDREQELAQKAASLAAREAELIERETKLNASVK